MKINNINLPFADAGSAEVCLHMRPNTCNTLEELGAWHDGTVTVALFNKPDSDPKTTNCCPLSITGP